MAITKKEEITKAGEHAEEREPSHTADGFVNWRDYCSKHDGDSEAPRDPAISLLGFFYLNMKNLSH